MAEKKSWRDYSKYGSTDESTDSKKTGTWRDYTSGGSTSGGWRDYSTFDVKGAVANDVISRVNGWLQNHNSYISDYQNRYSGRKYNYEDAYVSDSASWLDTVSKRKSEFDTEADSILAYLEQNKSYLNEDWVRSVRDTIASARSSQSQIIEAASKDNEWWAKFTPNEDQTAAGYTAGKLYNEWQVGQKQYAGDLAFDVAAGELELEGLKKDREAYIAEQEEKRKQALEDESFWDSLGRWLGTTPDTTIPLAGISGGNTSSNGTKYDKQISALEEQIERAKYVQGYEGYMGNMDAADYGVNSKYVSTRTDVAMEDARWGVGNTQYDTSKLFGDFLYDYINRNQDALDAAMVNDTATDAYFLGLDKGFLKTMSDDEIGVYNQLYYLDKTQGTDKATEFLNFIQSDLEGRRRAQEQANWAKQAKENPVGSSLFSVMISPMKAVTAVGQVADYIDDGAVDQNAAYNRFSYIPTSIREQVSSDIAKPQNGAWGKVGSWTYQLGMSMGDFLMNSAISGGSSTVSLALMGSGAMADTVISAKDRGLSDDQAMILGVVAGAAEIVTEKFSLDALFKGDLSKGAMRYILTNAFTEGTEEVSSSLINTVADVLASKDKSEWEMAIQDYLEKNPNATEEEAFQKVLGDNLLSLGLDFLGGALMGGTMGSAGAGINYVANARPGIKENIDAATKYGDPEIQKALIEEGLASDPNSRSYDLAKYYEKKTSKGKSMTGYEIRQLVGANEAQFVVENYDEALPLAKKRLADLGETGNIDKIADLVAKRASGQKLTASEKSALVKSQYGAKVAKEMTPETADLNYKSLESRVGAKSQLGVSESGKTVIRDTGEEIDIKKLDVATVGDGQLTFKVAEDREVSADSIDFADDSQSFLVSGISNIENITPTAATAMIHDIVDMEKPLGPQLNGIDEAFTYGNSGYSEADLKAGNFTTGLTSQQMMSAYKLGQAARANSKTNRVDSIKRMRTAVQAATEKAIAEGKAAPKAKGMSITYNYGNGRVVSIDEAEIKTAKQGGGTAVAKILLDMNLGTSVEFFSSKVVKDANGNRIRVFVDDNGVEQKAYSGVYRKSDGTIRIDLNAYNGKGLTLNALSHELTHFVQQWSPEKYEALADFLIKTYEKTDMSMNDRVLREQARLKRVRGEEVSYSEAYDEVVANAMSKMFDDGKLLEKLNELASMDKSLVEKILEGIKDFFNKFLAVYEKQSALFHDAADIMEIKENFEKLQSIFAEALVDASENFRAAQTIGFEMDVETNSVSPAVMYSEQTWTESDYVQQRDKAAQEIAKAIGVSKKKAKDYIDSVNSIAKMIAEDRSRLDYFSSPGRTSFVGNVEYGGSFDFSTLCKKRRLLTGTFTAIQKALPNTALTADEILDIRNRMKKANLEVSCGLCYVEGSRANMGQFAKEFLRLYKQYYPDAWQPNMADVNTPDGIEWVRINHPECYEQYEYFWNHYGTLKDGDKNLFASQQKPKLYQLHTEYKGEILQKFKDDDNVEEKNLNGGIRLQSFSDFEIVHLIDTMQIIMDMSRVGLAGQAYTKVPDFAWALGDTGLKINLSLIAKGVDANGKLIFDDVEGMPIAEAMKLRDRYSKNVGTILVAFNDEQLLAAMADDRVDFIIPFHRSQWKKSQYEAMGLPAKTKDYTFMQNEKFIKPTFHEYRGRMVKDKATNYMPNEYWDFSKSGKENAEAYLEMCARNNKRPKFYKLLQNNGDGSYSLKADGSTDGYWKLLIDFKMYDNEGNGSPQMAVKPEFNMEEATRMLNDYSGGHSNFPVAQGIVDSFVKDYKASHKGEQYSVHDSGDRFSMHDPVEETADLLAFHNITEKLLWDVLKQKGLVMPSVAVTNKGLNAFGEISLLFAKSVIDPAKNKYNKLYGADAWTPMQTSLKMNAKFDTNKTVNAVNSMKDRIGSKYVSELLNITPKQFKEAIIKADGNIYEAYAHNIGVQAAYAMEKGIISQIPTNKDGAVNKELLQKQLDKTLDTDEGWRQFRKWLNNISDTVITSYDQATNEDILRHMKAQPASAKTFKLSETGELIVPAKEYSSIKEMRRNKKRLSENAEEATKAVAAEFMEFAKKIGDTQKVVEAINAGFEVRYNIADIMRSFRNMGVEISSKQAGELQSLYKKAVELPTQYFEAKPGGTVGIENIHTAVVHENTSKELRQALEEVGINVLEYNGTKESRVEVMNSVKELRFSSQETDIDTSRKVNYHKENVKSQEVKGNEQREESREAFHARASKTLPEADERGALAFRFRRYSGQLSQNVRGAEEGLKNLGIPVVIFEELESNRDGSTTIYRNAGAAIPGLVVLIHYNTKMDAAELVAHEGYHYLATTDIRDDYTEVLADNVDFPSKSFAEYQKKYVDEKYFANDVVIGSKEWATFLEEVFAYITGHIHAGDPKGEVHKFLRDYDAVKDAWEDLIKKQATRNSQQYSSQETDADYMDAVNRGDMETAQRMVDEAAKQNGYPVKAYHGTSSFGFTKFDPAMSDDKTTLFFTDSLAVASTYAGKDIRNTKSIASAKSFQYERGKVYTEEELKEAHDFIQSKYHVYGLTKINVEKQTVTHAGTRYSAKQLMETADSISKEGIYGVYLNTDNVLEVDAGHTGWSGLKNPEADEWRYRIKYLGDGDFNYFKANSDDMFRFELTKNGEEVHNGTISFSQMKAMLNDAIGSSRAEMAIRHATDGSDIGSSRFDIAYSNKNGNYVSPTLTTRELAQYAKKKGYRGVTIKNLYDWGNKNLPAVAKMGMDRTGAATIYILFDSNQVKSADPVTYDEKGNVIPLSQRFNSKNDDIRYSEHDTDYSNRSLLANAFEGITKSSIEYEMIQEYKDRIKLLNEQEEKLAELNAEIREIRFTKGKYDAKKLKELEDEAKNVAKNINRHDKKLLSLEASEPLRKVIERERKKEAQKTKEHVREIQQNKKVRADQAELRHKIRKAVRDLDKILNRGNKKSNVKEDMKGFVSKALELADYLFTDHISNDELIRRGITVRMTKREAALVAETEEILSKLYDNADNLTNEEFTKLDAKRKSNMEKLRDLLTAQRNERLNTPVYNLFNDLVTEYASLKNSKQDAVKAAYDPNVERFLRSYIGESNGETDSDRKTLLQNMRVADMTTDELWKLHNAYKMVLTSVRDANKLWVKGKAESVEQMANRIAGDFSGRKIPEGKLAIVARNIANKIGWDYEKLHYALDRIGSEAFTELVMNIADSENIVMQDVMEAAAFRDEMVKNYGFNNWDVNKEIDREFLDSTGKKFKLTLGQLMALYAYSRREGAWDHIEYGGFVFGEAALTNPKPADSYKLSKAQCEAITDLLTKDQKAYVEAMQKFLSETMGEKGNEVSMLLYGIKMFGEKNYFPIKIAGQFKAQAQESQAKAAAGFSSMTNAGFTHEQNPNAKAPFVLEGFNDIWADHVNEMSRYHGTVPALEDMRRVMNRSFYSDSGMESMAIKQLMENSFGKDAVEYFDNLYKEANSGAIRDKLQHKSNKLLSLFRKNSVAYSLSVLVQQPAAMVRAYAMIDRKYFGFKGVGALPSGIVKAVSDKWTKAHTNAYNEMLKYAPGVTMAKEIGGFDTHTGGSIRSYLLDTGKSLKQKWKTGTVAEKGKAVMDLVDDNAIANLPNLADKIAWIEIWNACKRETIAKHKDLVPTSDEFLQIVGDRFTEIIRATQVYDSMFSKSPMLKSKNLAVQYLVSFMNEPNTVANMVEKAVRDTTKGNWKGGVRTAVAVVHSIIFTNVLKSIIYAMRDDDEDETYIEKYIDAVAGNMMSDFNALNYIPLVRDAWSLAQGYEVERADMAIVADALDALNGVIKNATKDTADMTEEELIEFDKKVTEANWKLVESVASFFGIPVKNIRREIEGVIDHARIAHANVGKTTAKTAWDKVRESVIDSIPFMSTPSKQDKLYDAIISGDKAYLARLKSTYKTDSAYQNAVRKALKENDPRIQEAAQARYDGRTEEYKRIFREIQKEGKFTFDDIMSAINSEVSKLSPDKVSSSYTASDYVESIILGDSKSAQTMKEDIIGTKVVNGMTQEDAEKAFTSSVATGIRDAYSSGLLNEASATEMLMEYADKDEEEAASKVSYWAFCEEHHEYKDVFTESHVEKYHEFAEPADISVEVYAQFIEGTKGLTTKKDEWGDVEVTKREQVLEVIDSLPLTWQQKDALYLAAGYSENQIWDVPW